jgi:3-hydroxybutyryl-CoA dehydratase
VSGKLPTEAGAARRWSASFEELVVGQRFRGGEHRVTEAEVIAFCALTGDWHPLHYDPAWAAASAFGERIAHGLLVLSLAVGLVPFDPARVLALRRLSDVVFKRPVRLGEAISVEGAVSERRPLDRRCGLVGLRSEIRNEDRALVCCANIQVLWSTDAAAAIGDVPLP